MPHHSDIPLFHHPILPPGCPARRDGWGAGREICQNKANFCREFEVSSGKFQAGTPQFTVPGRRPTPSLRAGPAAQNKANFREGQGVLITDETKSYDILPSEPAVKNKANFYQKSQVSSWRCQGGRPAPHTFRQMSTRRHHERARVQKQSQFPPARVNAGCFRQERQRYGPNGCCRNPAASPTARVGRAQVPDIALGDPNPPSPYSVARIRDRIPTAPRIPFSDVALYRRRQIGTIKSFPRNSCRRRGMVDVPDTTRRK